MLRFNFHGGFLDGLSLPGGRDESGMARPGERYIFLTDNGRIGARFRETPPERQAEWRRRFDQWMKRNAEQPASPEQAREFFSQLEMLGPEIYEVTGRDDRGGETIVRVDFIGDESDGTTVGGGRDPELINLVADLQFPEGRPNAADIAARDAIIRELIGDSSMMHGYGSNDEEPNRMNILTQWKDEALGRRRISEIIKRLLPGIEFTITVLQIPGP